ncbi:hypothetical protein SO802_012909 [Lithocarpus litseifolius]|uniref:MADS-box domain-containing protein n=1 Tax=Lithocarpus litseifolius TaxID=425828 RepID=A0AAW2D6Q6_9ROSI
MDMVIPKKTKKTQGRQKIEVKQLEGTKRQVTFSKRRAGLFKKASELCVLCGAEVAVMVITEKEKENEKGKGKTYCFGHPDVDTVLNRYLSENNNDNNIYNDNSGFGDSLPVDVNEFNRQYAEAEKVLEKEKRHLEEIEQKVKERGGGLWWDEALDENMGLEEMHHYKWALQEVRKKVVDRLNEMRMNKSMCKSSVVVPSVDLRLGDVGLENGFIHPSNLQGGNIGGGELFYSHGLGLTGPFGQGQ